MGFIWLYVLLLMEFLCAAIDSVPERTTTPGTSQNRGYTPMAGDELSVWPSGFT